MIRDVFLLALAMTWTSESLPAQDLLTAEDVVRMTAPTADHVLSYGSGDLEFGHLRLPEGPGPFPVILFVHGGCWLSEYDISHVGPLEVALADAGYAIWSLEYRRVGDDGGGWPGTFLDVARGADHLRAVARDFPLDLERVVAAGHSAGGQLALWLAARPKLAPESELYAADPLPVQGVVALAPAANLAALERQGVCEDVVDGLMGGPEEDYPERYAAASPMRLTPLGVPQMVVVGAHDQAWGPSGRAYVGEARAAGDEVELVQAPESGHFEMIVPGTSTWPLVLDAFREVFRRIERGRNPQSEQPK